MVLADQSNLPQTCAIAWYQTHVAPTKGEVKAGSIARSWPTIFAVAPASTDAILVRGQRRIADSLARSVV